MENKLNRYRTHMIISVYILLVIGLYMVRESSLIWADYLYGDENYYFKRQLIYALIGIVVFFLSQKIKLEFLRKKSLFLLIGSLFLLVIVIIPGVGISKNGSTSWLGFSFLSFQPSEFFKISLIIFMSNYLSKNYKESSKISTLLPLSLVIICGILLIMFQPDFGTCMVLSISIFTMCYLSRLNQKWFIVFILTGIILISVLIFSESYRFKRITAFIDPFQDPLGSGFQIIQSLYALGPGGLIGKVESIQKHFYLPEPQTDFIFAIFIEEFGLLGGIILILIYFYIFYCSYMILKESQNLFKSYLSIGLITLFMVQVIINLGVVIALFPVTGITLPLVSYGGSSLLVVLFSLGLIVNTNYEKDLIG